MTISELATGGYGWLDAHAGAILAISAAVPVGGTALAWLGHRGLNDRAGRLAANAALTFGLALFIALALAVAVAHWGFDRGPLDANALLLLAPTIALGLGLAGVRLVFPLGELVAAQRARSVGLLVLVLLGILWLFSQFRGWGVVFFGSIAQMVAIGALLLWLVRRLYRRAFKPDRSGERP